jgi:hypothetical protein
MVDVLWEYKEEGERVTTRNTGIPIHKCWREHCWEMTL